MSSLYNLTNDYETVLNMLYDEDIDEQMILDTLEGIEGEIEDKADGYAKIMKELQAVARAKQDEADRLNKGAKVLINRLNTLKQNLFNAMKETGKTKFATDLFSFNIQKNGGKLPLIIDDIEIIPEEYFKHTEKELDNTKIRQAIDSGIDIPFAHYGEQGESLRIK